MNEPEIMTNIEFDFPILGKTYKIKKASIKQVIDWQRKVSEIQKEKDAGADLRMIAYAIYAIIHSVDTTVTEDYILENVPGDLNAEEILLKLGFLNQQKVAMMGRIKNSLGNQ